MGYGSANYYTINEVEKTVNKVIDTGKRLEQTGQRLEQTITRLERTVEYLARRESPAQTFEEYYKKGVTERMNEINNDHNVVDDIKHKEEENARKVRERERERRLKIQEEKDRIEYERRKNESERQEKERKEYIEKITRDYNGIWASSLANWMDGNGRFHPRTIFNELVALHIIILCALIYYGMSIMGLFVFIFSGIPAAYGLLHILAMFILYKWHPADYEKARPYDLYMRHGAD